MEAPSAGDSRSPRSNWPCEATVRVTSLFFTSLVFFLASFHLIYLFEAFKAKGQLRLALTEAGSGGLGAYETFLWCLLYTFGEGDLKEPFEDTNAQKQGLPDNDWSSHDPASRAEDPFRISYAADLRVWKLTGLISAYTVAISVNIGLILAIFLGKRQPGTTALFIPWLVINLVSILAFFSLFLGILIVHLAYDGDANSNGGGGGGGLWLSAVPLSCAIGLLLYWICVLRVYLARIRRLDSHHRSYLGSESGKSQIEPDQQTTGNGEARCSQERIQNTTTKQGSNGGAVNDWSESFSPSHLDLANEPVTSAEKNGRNSACMNGSSSFGVAKRRRLEHADAAHSSLECQQLINDGYDDEREWSTIDSGRQIIRPSLPSGGGSNFVRGRQDADNTGFSSCSAAASEGGGGGLRIRQQNALVKRLIHENRQKFQHFYRSLAASSTPKESSTTSIKEENGFHSSPGDNGSQLSDIEPVRSDEAQFLPPNKKFVGGAARSPAAFNGVQRRGINTSRSSPFLPELRRDDDAIDHKKRSRSSFSVCHRITHGDDDDYSDEDRRPDEDEERGMPRSEPNDTHRLLVSPPSLCSSTPIQICSGVEKPHIRKSSSFVTDHKLSNAEEVDLWTEYDDNSVILVGGAALNDSTDAKPSRRQRQHVSLRRSSSLHGSGRGGSACGQRASSVGASGPRQLGRREERRRSKSQQRTVRFSEHDEFEYTGISVVSRDEPWRCERASFGTMPVPMRPSRERI